MGHCGPPIVGRIQQLDYSTMHKWHKQGATELLILVNKYLSIVTLEYDENC